MRAWKKAIFAVLFSLVAGSSVESARAYVVCPNGDMPQSAPGAGTPGTHVGSSWILISVAGSIGYMPDTGGCSPNPGDPKAAGYCTLNPNFSGTWPNFVNCSGMNCTNPLASTTPSAGGVNPYQAPYYVKIGSSFPVTEASRCTARLTRDCATVGSTYDYCDLAGSPFASALGGCTCSHDASCAGGVGGNPCYNNGSTPSPTPSAAPSSAPSSAPAAAWPIIPPGDCTGVPSNPGSFKKHGCGTNATLTGPPQCADSDMPDPAPPGTFADLVNPMAACCSRGWGENNSSALKFDCVEAVAPAKPTIQSFLEFYLAGATKDDVTTAGIAYPNQMFVLDDKGVPVNGFYNQNGRRCRYRNAGTKTPVTLSAAQQMALFITALNEMKPPAGAGYPAEVDPYCCNLVVFALERKCPETDPIGGKNLATTYNGTRRCTAAKRMKLDFAIFDLCDPNLVKRGRFRVATSYEGENLNFVSIFPNAEVNILNLIAANYPPSPLPTPIPSPLPSPYPPCPNSSAVIELPWTGGKCRLRPSEPYP